MFTFNISTSTAILFSSPLPLSHPTRHRSAFDHPPSSTLAASHTEWRIIGQKEETSAEYRAGMFVMDWRDMESKTGIGTGVITNGHLARTRPVSWRRGECTYQRSSLRLRESKAAIAMLTAWRGHSSTSNLRKFSACYIFLLFHTPTFFLGCCAGGISCTHGLGYGVY